MEVKQLFEVGFKEKYSETGYFEKTSVVADNVESATVKARSRLIVEAEEGDWYETDEEKREYLQIIEDLKVAFVSHEGEIWV